jgi:hypothetical protein
MSSPPMIIIARAQMSGWTPASRSTSRAHIPTRASACVKTQHLWLRPSHARIPSQLRPCLPTLFCLCRALIPRLTLIPCHAPQHRFYCCSISSIQLKHIGLVIATYAIYAWNTCQNVVSTQHLFAAWANRDPSTQSSMPWSGTEVISAELISGMDHGSGRASRSSAAAVGDASPGGGHAGGSCGRWCESGLLGLWSRRT